MRPLDHISAFLPVSLAATLAAIPLAGQEILAVDFGGNAVAVSPYTGETRLIGPTGVSNCNAMAEQDGVYWISAKNGTQHQLAILDRFTAQATVQLPNLGVDLRGLAPGPDAGQLFGIVNAFQNQDRLVRIQLATGAVIDVGPTNRSGIQSLVMVDGVLWAWDVSAGLLRLNRTTGASFDPFPFHGTFGADIQYLTLSHAGQLFGGNHRLYKIGFDGTVDEVGPNTTLDLRGGDFRSGSVTSFGDGCSAGGFPTALLGFSSGLVGVMITLYSPGHQMGATGFVHVGTATGATTVPGALCPLAIVPDVSIPVDLGFGSSLKVAVPLPPLFGGHGYFQATVFEPTANEITVTNAIDVHMPR
ncbi:MAG: hypothetical protein KDE27_19025 [Planctomycetes bacterium]|nr:hypothetical protein [Planctomycetota bacterium]